MCLLPRVYICKYMHIICSYAHVCMCVREEKNPMMSYTFFSFPVFNDSRNAICDLHGYLRSPAIMSESNS